MDKIESLAKEIEVTDTGTVNASVFCGDRRCGLEFFHSIFNSLESRLKKAHAWADNHIEICKKYEVQK